MSLTGVLVVDGDSCSGCVMVSWTIKSNTFVVTWACGYVCVPRRCWLHAPASSVAFSSMMPRNSWHFFWTDFTRWEFEIGHLLQIISKTEIVKDMHILQSRCYSGDMHNFISMLHIYPSLSLFPRLLHVVIVSYDLLKVFKISVFFLSSVYANLNIDFSSVYMYLNLMLDSGAKFLNVLVYS